MEMTVRTSIALVMTCVLALALTFYFVNEGPSIFMMLAISVSAALLPLLFTRPEIGLVLLIITRNGIDIFDQSGAAVGGLSLNLASLLGIFVVPWALIVIIRVLSHRSEGITRSLISLPLLPVWAALLGVTILSFTRSSDIMESITLTIKLLNYALLYVVGFVLAQRIRVRTLYMWLATALIIPSGFGVYQFITSTTFTAADVTNRLHGTFAHPNAFAFALVIGITATITLFASSRHTFKYLWAGLGTMFFLLLLFTYTRSAWIGIFIVGLVWLLGYYRKLILPLTIWAAILILAFPALATFSYDAFGVRLEETSLVKRAGISDDESTESFNWRTRTWKETLPAVWEYPILGHGIGMFSFVRQRFVGFETDLRSLAAHNDYLKLAIEIGLVGLALYLVLFARILSLLLSRMTDTDRAQPYLLGFAAITLAMLVMSFSDNILRNAPVQWMFWSLTGVMMAAISVSRSNIPKQL